MPVYKYKHNAGIGKRPWFCPLRLVDDPVSTAYARRVYDAWRGGLVALVDLFALPEISSQIAPLVTGFLTAALVGYLSISWLMSFLVRRGLNFFSAYCFFLGISVLLMGQIRG